SPDLPAQAALPEAVSENDGAGILQVRRRESAALGSLNSEQREEIDAGRDRQDLLPFAVPQKGFLSVGPGGGCQFLKAVAGGSPLLEFAIGVKDRAGLAVCGVALPNYREPVGVAIRQRSEEHRIDDG